MRKLLLTFVMGVAIAVAGALAYRFLFEAEPESPQWILATFTGDVEVSLRGGAWEPAEIKMRLTDKDRLRTGEDGEAMLLHDSSHVAVRPRTELQVARLTDEVSDFDIAEGNVQVEARGDRVVMRTLADARVDASDAGLGMTVKPDGYVEVAVQRGEADFSAVGVTQRVAEGERSHAEAGRPPSTPRPIPQAILLAVQFPDADTFNSRLARIQGRVEPGTRVQVGGRWTETDGAGRFELDVELEEGANQIEVAAVDTLGRRRVERSRPISVDVTSPWLEGASIGSRRVPTSSGNGDTP